ncbi:MAG: hypothetical protein GQ569_08615 [Methylococcaceae bacterium]|nr:hypothetical protein [Methylococcaceae bacterium]
MIEIDGSQGEGGLADSQAPLGNQCWKLCFPNNRSHSFKKGIPKQSLGIS